jgi:hypothetical protein
MSAAYDANRAARHIQRQPGERDAAWPAMDVPEGFYLGPYATAKLTGEVGELLAEAERKGAESVRAMLALVLAEAAERWALGSPGTAKRHAEVAAMVLDEIAQNTGISHPRPAWWAATHDQVTPALREGQAVEYRSWATGPGRTPGTWTPAIFRGYGDQANATVTQLSGSGFVMSKTYEIRPVPAEVMTEARGWLADNQWADADADDIAEAKDLDILRAIQRHYLFGWTGFRQNYGSEG